MNQQEIAVLVEQTEAEGWIRLFDADNYDRIDDAIVCATTELDMLAFNRVIGLGTQKAFTTQTIERILNWYRAKGIPRCMLALSPFTMNEDADALLVAAGFKRHNHWAKLFSPIDRITLPPPNPKIDIIEAKEHEAEAFVPIILKSFDWPDALLPMITRMFYNGLYKKYFATFEGKKIAAGALFIYGNIATMAIAGTVPDYRGLGAQKALLRKRIEDARDTNCTCIATETGKDTPEKPNLSYRNMRAIGLDLLYLRRNYLFEFESDGIR